MNQMLQEQGAKHVCPVPEGLHKLCSDISREVLRSQPTDIYCFIANYVEGLLSTRESTAIKVVDDIVTNTEDIVNILCGLGVDLKKIAAIVPELQEAFREYIDTKDTKNIEDDYCNCDDKVSIEKVSSSWLEDAKKATTIIQAALRGHCPIQEGSKDEIQWKPETVNTMEIIPKTGDVSLEQAEQAATTIQLAYRKYRTRKKNTQHNVKNDENDAANRAATIIQSHVRGHQARKRLAQMKSQSID